MPDSGRWRRSSSGRCLRSSGTSSIGRSSDRPSRLLPLPNVLGPRPQGLISYIAAPSPDPATAVPGGPMVPMETPERARSRARFSTGDARIRVARLNRSRHLLGLVPANPSERGPGSHPPPARVVGSLSPGATGAQSRDRAAPVGSRRCTPWCPLTMIGEVQPEASAEQAALGVPPVPATAGGPKLSPDKDPPVVKLNQPWRGQQRNQAGGHPGRGR